MRALTSTTQQNQKTDWYAWYVVIILTTASTVSYIDRQVVAMMVGPIKRDLNITDTEMAFLMGPAFAFSYALVTLPMGWLADRYIRKNMIAVGVFAWSIVTALSGLAQSYTQLVGARMGVGIGEASLGPAAYSMVSDYFPQDRVALALSVFSSAPFIGVGLANIFGGVLIDYLETFETIAVPLIGEVRSWQATFLIVGLPGVLLASVIYFTREPARGKFSDRMAENASSIPIREVFKFMRGNWPFFVLQFSGVMALSTIGYAVFGWGPELFLRAFDMSKSEFGLTYGPIAIIFGLAGASFAGALVPIVLRRGYPDAVLRIVIFAAALILPIAAIYPLLSSTTLAIVCLCFVTFTMAMPTGMVTASLQAVTPNEMKAQVISIYLFVVFTFGFTAGPQVIGILNDVVFPSPDGIRYSFTTVAVICYPLSMIFLGAALPFFRKALAEAQAWQEPIDGDAGDPLDIEFGASAVIPAKTEQVWAMLVDYRAAHPETLPKPAFANLDVKEGGSGAGTKFDLQMQVLGARRSLSMTVSEPEPGRILLEEDKDAGVSTAFILDPVGDSCALNIVTSTRTSPGFRGIVESLITPFVVRRVFRKQLRLIARKFSHQRTQQM